MEETARITTTMKAYFTPPGPEMKHQMTRTQVTKKLIDMTARNNLEAKQRGKVIPMGNREKSREILPRITKLTAGIYTESI